MTGYDSLIRLLAAHSVQRGVFTLASGRRTSLYIDARLTTMSPEGLTTIGPLALDRLHSMQWEVDSVGGLTLGADPISYAISYASAFTPRSLRAFTIRKEMKRHGTEKRIEGAFRSGDHVTVIEDVITTGGSVLNAVNTLRSAGAKIVGILALVDRQEGGRERLEEAGLAVTALVTMEDLTSQLK
jgi:orotate phosphoribosyltransferase